MKFNVDLFENLQKFNFQLHSKVNSKNVFKANLTCYFSQFGSLLYWNIELLENTTLDLCSTPNWFKNKNHNFEQRNIFLQLLNYKQIPRKTRSSKENIVLNSNELKILNKWFKEEYFGSIKNIGALLKGNNPAGSYHQPFSSEIKTNIKKIENNLIMFIDILNTSLTKEIKKMVNTKQLNLDNYLSEKPMEFEEFINSLDDNSAIKATFEFVESEKVLSLKNTIERKKFNELKKLIKSKIDNFSQIEEYVANECTKARSKLKKIVQIFQWEKFMKTENAHIYPVYLIKRETLDFLKNEYLKNQSDFFREKLNFLIKKLNLNNKLSEIYDINNFLNLPPNLHKLYDTKKFFWDYKKGELTFINNQISNSDKTLLLQHAKVIDNLNDKMQKYLKKYQDFLKF
ncbi:MAG4270 family putative restriction endonuclease [Mycoplasmopsis columbina]|uniref:MAG4270 family putative restriction endonuclease n=1 Tax=Mycoplasmopsis columbina TaxID=114881 RepID=UPI0004A6BCC5|nr:HNH endonuclease [Mycoplasmopsis columbina]VEU76932.1 Uncharacterised protein [Mycoplasmopsis columbina]